MIRLKTFKLNVDEVISSHGLEKGGRVQMVVDSEVVRRMDKYIPVRTHKLRQSVQSSTTIGSGEIKQPGPYARRQYHENTGRLQSGLRSGKWFERMKSAEKADILRMAAQEAGGKAK